MSMNTLTAMIAALIGIRIPLFARASAEIFCDKWYPYTTYIKKSYIFLKV